MAPCGRLAARRAAGGGASDGVSRLRPDPPIVCYAKALVERHFAGIAS